MASAWSDAAAAMDAAVDEHLGDRIDYSFDGATFGTLAGFVLFSTQPLSLEAIDEILGARPRVKIAKALVPYPEPTQRLRCTARLGSSTFRPAGNLPDEDGRYWIFDIEKA